MGTGCLTVGISPSVGSEPEAEIAASDLRAVRDEFADVTSTLERQSRDLGAMVADSDEWMAGLNGNDPGSGEPWNDVVSRQLSEGQADVLRMRAEATSISDSLDRALSALRKSNEAGAFRLARSAAVAMTRLTEDAASSGKNITLTLGTTRPLLERLGNGEGLQRIAASLQLQTRLMRDLRQTEAVVPASLFPDVIRGEVEPAEIKSARQDFRAVSSSLDKQLADLSYLVTGQSGWDEGSEAVDPGTGQPWGVVLKQRVEASRTDVQRLDLQAGTISGSLARAVRSAMQDNEGGIRRALRSAARDLQQLIRDAKGVGNNLTMTLSSMRPLLERVGDRRGLLTVADALRLHSTLLEGLGQAQKEVNGILRK